MKPMSRMQNNKRYKIKFLLLALFCGLRPHLLRSHDTYQPSIPQQVDISINGIFLHDAKSLVKIIPSIQNLKESETESELPHLNFCNNNCTQILTLVFHSGGIKNEAAEIQVKKNKNDTKEKSMPILKEIKNFITGKGIQLGMSRKKLINILGNPEKISRKSGTLDLQYQIDDSNTAFLKKFNMPLYYGHYSFENEQLVKFSFGFQYP